MEQPEILEGQECPFCHNKTLTLMESQQEIPYFGVVYLFSMNCSSCHYHKADIEAAETKDPKKYTLEVSSEEDLKIRIVKSSHATVKIPHIMTISPGESANGYISNVEGILKRVIHMIEDVREGSDDKAEKDKAKKMLKKLNKVMWGQDKLKIILEDPTGNSAIISDKVEIKKLK